jgi:predicted transcriptional regulator
MTRDLEQPQVARLELGDVNPTFETLLRLAGGLWRASPA